MFANGASMVALLVVGGVADAAGVETALFAVAVLTLLAASASVQMRRQVRRAGDVRPPPVA